MVIRKYTRLLPSTSSPIRLPCPSSSTSLHTLCIWRDSERCREREKKRTKTRRKTARQVEKDNFYQPLC